MPIYNSPDLHNSRLLLWNINESESELISSIILTDYSKSRLKKIKSNIQRKQFLGVQNLLKLLEIKNDELSYDINGKPILNNQYISISHSFNYCGLVVSPNKVGLDIEKLRPKVLNISNKFVSAFELNLIKKVNIRNITKIWTVKEAVFKAFGFPSVNFKENIIIQSFNDDFDKAIVKIYNKDVVEYYSIEIINFSQYICSVAIQIK